MPEGNLLTAAILGFIAITGTLVNAVLVYRASRANLSQVENDTHFKNLQAEVDRLREDLKDRDIDARNSHKEILELRALIFEHKDEINELRVELAKLRKDTIVLYNQLIENNIKPLVVPDGIAVVEVAPEMSVSKFAKPEDELNDGDVSEP